MENILQEQLISDLAGYSSASVSIVKDSPLIRVALGIVGKEIENDTLRRTKE